MSRKHETPTNDSLPLNMNSTKTLNLIRKTIRKADPGLKEDDESYKAAAVLLASVSVGPNQQKIACLLGYPRSLISSFAWRLKKSGVWSGGRVYADWDDEKTGGIAFWCDVSVARGLLERSK